MSNESDVSQDPEWGELTATNNVDDSCITENTDGVQCDEVLGLDMKHDVKDELQILCGNAENMSSYVNHKVDINDHSALDDGSDDEEVGCAFTCCVCDQQFGTLLDLQCHRKNENHNFTEDPDFCPFCEKQFSCRDDLELHTCTRAFSCTLCNQMFVNSCELSNHMHVHRRDETLTCKVCSKRFKFLFSAVRHMHVHNDMRLFSCDVCGDKFYRVHILKQHRTLHSVDQQFTCNICLENCTDLPTFIQHKISHCDADVYRCDYCNSRFPNKDELEVHLYRHIEEKSYTCAVCKKLFLNRCELKIHMRIHRRKEIIACHICGKEFSHRGNFARHVQDRHTGTQSFLSPEGQRKFSCSVCGKHFLFATKFESHKRIHARKQETTADVGKNQTKIQGLSHNGYQQLGTKHQTVDTHPSKKEIEDSQEITDSMNNIEYASNKQVTNNVCKEKTSGSYQLLSNEMSCSVCDKTFVNFSELESHLHVHRHEDTFNCNLCYKKISQCNNFIRHMRMHVGKPVFSCGVCGKTSYRSDLIVYHMRSHSNEKETTGDILSDSDTTLNAFEQQQPSSNHDSLICDVCKKRFTHLAAFEAHICTDSGMQQIAGSAGKKQVLFSNELSLEENNEQNVAGSTSGNQTVHRLTSHKGKYTCSVCSETFTKYPELEAHLHSHKYEESFLCNVCNKRIGRCNNFIRHMRIHFCPPMFSCGVCGLRTHFACDVKKHMLVHTVERPFSCDECGKKFIRQTNLNLHQRTHGKDVGI